MAQTDPARTKIATCLWFGHGRAYEAATFYAGLFPDSHVDTRHAAPADHPGGQTGSELMVEFTLMGMACIGLNGLSQFSFNPAVSFQVYTDSQEETDRYWEALIADGGAPSQCGWCRDKFGLSWQIIPRALITALSDPDRDAAGRAMQAMMGMTRIDIAAIERAHAAGMLP